MRLSTKGRYAVTAMMDLAIHEPRGPVTLADISRCQSISLSYLEQLFSKLRRENLVRGVRGPGGGYRLAKPIEEIDVASIMTAVDDQAYVPAAANTAAEDEIRATDRMWDNLSSQLYDYLGTVTLDEVLKGNEVEEEEHRKVA